MRAVLHYYCREGFDLVGTASQECLPIGEWSSYTPLCVKGESVGGAACMCACVVMFKVLITQQCTFMHVCEIIPYYFQQLCVERIPSHKSVVLSFLVDTAVYGLVIKEHKLTSYSMRCVAK